MSAAAALVVTAEALPTPRIVRLDTITIRPGRRALDPDWVETLAWDIKHNTLERPIDLAEIGELLVLVTGRHRAAAMAMLGADTIPAYVRPLSHYIDESRIKLREIAENLIRRPPSALDRAFDVADWRDIYLSTQNVVGRGRPKKQSHDETNFREGWSDADQEQLGHHFSVSLPRAAAEVLGIERATLFRDLKIASLGQALREKISLLPIANNASELLALAREELAERRDAVAQLMLTTFPIPTVAEALRRLDHLPADPKPHRWEKLSASFSRLKQPQQDAFFAAHEEAIRRWLRGRDASNGVAS